MSGRHGDALLGRRKADEEHDDGECGEDQHRELKALEFVDDFAGIVGAAAELFDEGADEQRDEESAAEGADEAVTRSERAAGRGGADHAEHRALRDVDERLGQQHEAGGEVGVDEFAGGAEVGTGEEQIATEPVRKGEPEEIGTELALAGLRGVGQEADQRIDGGVEEADCEKHRADHGGCEASDVGVEIGKENAEGLEEEIRGGIAEGVADGFAGPQAGGGVGGRHGVGRE